MKKGCYPFSLEPEFETRLRQVINTTVEVDIPKYAKMTIAATQKLKKFMYYISKSVPVKINFSDMARDLELNRDELPKYLEYLEKAELVSVLRIKANGDGILRKMDKLYLHNSNMAYVLSGEQPNTGNSRKNIFFCWTKQKFDTLESPVSDFEIDGKTFEVGGRKKGKKQIEDVQNGFRSDIKGDHIEVTTVKTADSISIELNKVTKDILEKYKDTPFKDNKALPNYTNQAMNRDIKELCKLAGINEEIRVTTYKGNVRTDKIQPKWELVGTHTGRRTFIVNALSLGITPNIVMKWTGHSDYKAMKPYIGIVDSIKANEMTKLDMLVSGSFNK